MPTAAAQAFHGFRARRDRTVHKVYLAVTVGVPPSAAFTVDAPIGAHPAIQEARAVGGEGGKHAATDFTVRTAARAQRGRRGRCAYRGVAV